MSGPSDATVGQTVKETKALLAAAPGAISAAQKEIVDIAELIENTMPGSAAAAKAREVALAVASGSKEATGAVAAVSSLLKEMSIPLALTGGIKLHGTGVLLKDVQGAYEGLRSAMTKHQVWLYYISGALLILIGIAGDVTTLGQEFLPGKWGIMAALAAVKVGGIAKMLTPLLRRYADKFKPVPRAELVAIPADTTVILPGSAPKG